MTFVLLGSLTGALLGWLMGFLSLFLILLILVQRGKGGGLTGALGGPGGQSAFGSKAGDTFTVITIVVASIWGFTCAFTMWLLGTHTPTTVSDTNVQAGPGDDGETTAGDDLIIPSGAGNTGAGNTGPGIGGLPPLDELGDGEDTAPSETPSMELTPADAPGDATETPSEATETPSDATETPSDAAETPEEAAEASDAAEPTDADPADAEPADAEPADAEPAEDAESAEETP